MSRENITNGSNRLRVSQFVRQLAFKQKAPKQARFL